MKKIKQNKTTLDKYLSKSNVVDLDEVGEINKISLTVNGKRLPLNIGDKLIFPDGDVLLKTVAAIQIDENGDATYLLEWYDDDSFKQYWIGLTELKLLKDRIIQKAVISLNSDNDNSKIESDNK